ncbi:1-(5-phosphoribosyl)-5-[(5-phosphoribosylamino)methylideneamino] imidazole-4-carboxamide isomerase [Aestuariicoccus sp. MJ-SS9]|uniref:1-(5-phosphoribosyl)-5-[(5- phosphoribosylamino)methylideneamino]imidazole-4- carboxamide isomerase n=1 Tax=Aestuariicoccus sp. MJ-SS9 TaxID=3079855 RepID=UPI002908CFF3|nr:1-(5-phosphoribosyl)-5-[(5-phosphoribosylamino)methylideneamino] imidazole-4-carboxamide isomerase [Aestuariicoccus sp. MJ-SS9]MDU8910486.1 1-(5-phosphoribosyl)-5-[(5-phosphoribosylamino)methylideneamino] imidazole-4-carboxamide isomerase [Aestuariicoccus sp. MJ-SS9]
MQIIPTLELQNGRCVTLRKGRMADPILWHVDPVETALGFVEAGASALRITDFDAIAGAQGNDALIETLLRKVGVPVQIAGGIRSRERAEYWIDKGAGQVVIGTLAVQAPRVVMELAKYHPDMVVLSLDVWQGKLMTHGWNTPSAFTPEAFLDSFRDVPLAGVVVTDIDSDDEDVDAQLGLITGLAAHTRHPVIASGVVDTLDDIARLKYVYNIAGVLVGRALMRKTFALADALSVAQESREKVADFQ